MFSSLGNTSTTGSGAFGVQQQQQPGTSAPTNNLFGTLVPASSTQPATGGGLFGNTQQNTTTGTGNSIFGTSAASTQPQSTTGGLFGNTQSQNAGAGGGLFGTTTQQQQPTGGGGLFGNTSTSTTQPATGGGLFGSTTTTQPSSTTGGLFGNAPNTQPASGGLFGGMNTSTTQPASGGLFGNIPTAQPSTTGGLFGNTSTTQPASGGLFGNTQANTGGTTGGLFGTAPSTTQTGGGLFGNTSGGPNASTTSGGLFGNTNTSTTGGGLFGNAPSSTTGGLFGNTSNIAPMSTGGGLFGTQPQTNTSTNAPSIFGNTANTQTGQQTQGPGSSIFGQSQQQPGSSIFGNLNSTTSAGRSLLPGSTLGGSTLLGSTQNNLFASKAPALSSQQQSDPQSQFAALVQRIQAIAQAWNPTSPECRFQHFFYNLVDPNQVHLYGRPHNAANDTLWHKAVRENPDPSCLVPVLAFGFDDLQKRVEAQSQQTAVQQERLKELQNRIAALSQRHQMSNTSRVQRASALQAQLTYRILKLVQHLHLLIPALRSSAIRPEEEALRAALEDIDQELRRPGGTGRIRGKLNELWALVGAVNAAREQRDRKTSGVEWAVVDEDGLAQITQILAEEQAGLAHLTKILQKDLKDLAVIEGKPVKDEEPDILLNSTTTFRGSVMY